MRSLITLLAICWLVCMGLAVSSSTCFAAPWLVCDPNPGATSYQIEGLATMGLSPIQPAQDDGSLKLDVAMAQIGDTNLVVKACNMWECSSPVPFTFTRPLAPSSASVLRLEP